MPAGQVVKRTPGGCPPCWFLTSPIWVHVLTFARGPGLADIHLFPLKDAHFLQFNKLVCLTYRENAVLLAGREGRAMRNQSTFYLVSGIRKLGSSVRRLGCIASLTGFLLGCANPFSPPSSGAHRIGGDTQSFCPTTTKTENGQTITVLDFTAVRLKQLDGQMCRAAFIRSLFAKRISDLSWQQPAADFLTIGSGVAAASALAFDWSDDVLKFTGIVAGTSQVTSAYVNTAQKGLILNQGINRLSCVVNVSIPYSGANAGGYAQADVDKATLLISEAISSIVADTDKQYAGSFAAPSYASIISSIGSFVTPQQLVGGVTPVDFEKLSRDLGVCVTKA